MKPAITEQRSALYLAGHLTAAEAAAFERDLAAAGPAERETLAAMSDAAALTVMASVSLRKAPPSARSAIMAAAGIALNDPPPAAADKFTYVMNDEGWAPLPFPGGRIKYLFIHPGGRHRAFLLELQPGVHLPEHPHAGYEECLILTGDLVNEGRDLGPGDYVRAAAGTDHLEVFTRTGCVCLIIASAA